MKRTGTIGIFLGMLLLAGISSLRAQDFHLSQTGTAPLHTNPARTGKTDGTFRAHGHYRSQWSSLTPNPFNTSIFSFEMPFDRFGAGLYIRSSRAGEGNFGIFNMMLSGSYDQKLNEEGTHRLSLGVQGGFMQKSVDPQQLRFESQYTTRNGGSFDPSLSSGESFQRTSFTVPDLNAGLLYYHSRESSRFQPFLGATVSHILEPEESFFQASNSLPMRYLFHGGTRINLSKEFQLLAKGMSMYQTNDREHRVGLLAHYLLENGAYLIFGPNWRSRDAVIVETGVEYESYQVRVSYDINTSRLRPATNGRGGFEISFIYTGYPPEPDPVDQCPRF
jgi:type IX secretion system PorP/SprF family membrane protein